MAKTKKLSFNSLADEIKEQEVKTIRLDPDSKFEIHVKPTLSMGEAMKFVNNVVSACVDLETMNYTPEAYDLALRLATIVTYTDIEPPKNYEKAYKVLYETKLYDKILDCVNKEHYFVLVDAAYDHIEYLKNSLISVSAVKMGEVVDKMNKMMDDSANTLKEMNSDEFKMALASMQDIISASEGEDVATETSERTAEIIPFKKPEE